MIKVKITLVQLSKLLSFVGRLFTLSDNGLQIGKGAFSNIVLLALLLIWCYGYYFHPFALHTM